MLALSLCLNVTHLMIMITSMDGYQSMVLALVYQFERGILKVMVDGYQSRVLALYEFEGVILKGEV